MTETSGELRPLRKPKFGRKEDLIAALRGVASVDFAQFRADIDEFVDQGFDPRG